MKMNILEKIKREVRQKLTHVNSCHEWEHTERVFNLAMNIGKKEKADLEVLGLATILHDIARKEQDESGGKIDHAERGAVLATEILRRNNFSEQKIRNIAHCIKSHRYRNDVIPETVEAKILYDADKLDAIGAIGIGRAFSFAGHIGAKVHNKEVNLTPTVEYSVDDSAWREYNIKLKNIKDKMLTREGKRVAEGRHSFMEEFFTRLNKEVDGEI